MKKTVIAILMTALMMISIMAPLVSTAQADVASWYTSVGGALYSDYYSLYPYSKFSVNVGFSKFGELIGLPAGKDPTTATQADYIGLEYLSTDPFCPATVVPMTSWINGWYIDLQYIDPALSGALRDRHLFAFAMFGDGFGFGGDWAYAATPGSNPGHGRQTNGVCVTDPLTVLYNGPREYIAMAVTHIYDKQGTTTWPVVDLAITMRFNKVSKEVVLYKDVKLKLPKLHLWGKLDVQLSNREEYDLGPAPSYDSYVHFYKDFDYTPYDANWHMASNLLREYVDYFVGDGVNKVFTVSAGSNIATDFIKIWIDGVFQDPSTYTVNWNTGVITFASPPAKAAIIEVHYKYVLMESMWQYDLAQVISSDGAYVAWAAMWPPVSDYTVDGILRYMDPLVQVNEDDMDYEPKQSPLIIGEWDFLMDHTVIPQYRCVEVKGVTDRHDAQDSDHGDGNVVDREAKYQLDMVFNPWDLNNAVEKKTERWVEWKTSTSSSFTTHVRPGVFVPTSMWDQYGVFSERVIAYFSASAGGPRLLNRWLGEYSVTLNAAGYLAFTGLPSVRCKILYSTKAIADIVVLIGDAPGHSAPSGLGLFANAYGGDPGRDEVMFTADDLDYARVISDMANKGISVLGVNYGNGTAAADANFAYIAANTAGAVYNGPDKWNASVTNWVVSATSMGKGVDVAFVVDLSGSMGGSIIADVKSKIANIVDNLAAYDVTFGVGAFVDYPHAYDSYGYASTYGATPDYAWNMVQDLTEDGVLVKSEVAALTATGGADYPQDYARALYESQFFTWRNMGRYEWIEVGRDGAAVDNTGAALVAEAFDSYKIIGIGISGNDMFNAELANQCPNIMSKFNASGLEVLASYKDTIGRAALADDWCTYWPVASSNIIGVGGPLANLFAYYANDFEDAFYGMSPYAGSIYSGYLTGIPCWNRGWAGVWNVYSSFATSTVGYAVISTTIDLNGTVLFNVYGHFGRDTYYACQWLHGDEARALLDPGVVVGSPGIKELQLAPEGLTSIILRISYGSDPKHPYFSVVECEGTISETLWYCWGNGGYDVTTPIKGGIHDP